MNDSWFGCQCSPGPSMGFGIPCGGGIVERDQRCSFGYLETIAKRRATVEEGLDSKIYSSPIIAYTLSSPRLTHRILGNIKSSRG
jgi:hypothetical protein